MSSAFVLFVAGSLMAQSQPAEPKALRWGSIPPPLKVSGWATHRPKSLPGPQTDGNEHIFVVYFWSMRDEVSRQAIPFLAQLQATYANDRVAVIALSNEDLNDLTNGVSRPAEIPYAVAADAENQTTEAWLADVSGFPWAFVLDRSGRILWSGDRLWDLRDAVAGAVKGSYTLAAARKKIDAGRNIENLTGALNDAMGNGDMEAVLRVADRIIDADPSRSESYGMKRSLLKRLGKTEKMPALNGAMRRAMWDSAAGLAELIDWQWAETDLKHRDPALMRRCAERLVELTDRKDPFAWSMLARVLHELGLHDDAIAAQSLAADYIKWDPEKSFAAMLDYYRRVKRAAGEAASRPTGSRPASRPGKALEEL